MVRRGEHRVAIATEDGKRIAGHFRKAPYFIVYTVKGGRIVSGETRVNSHASGGHGDGHAECWEVVEELLDDVRVVIASGMGRNAYIGMLRRDMLPLLTDETSVQRAIKDYVRGRLKDRPELIHEEEAGGESATRAIPPVHLMFALRKGENGKGRVKHMTSCGSGCKEEGSPLLQAHSPHIRNKIMVLSGKGGVGKSSIAACLALGLSARGYRVGLMDVDFHGPSIPVIFGLRGSRVTGDDRGINPVIVGNGLKVISIGFFLEEQDHAVIWRGPLKMSAIRQFIEEIHWGELDFLIIDSPPGTGDEPLSVVQLIPGAFGLVVTTPQELSVADVRKSINFCRSTGMRLLGLVENMGGLTCPHCGKEIPLFGQGGAEAIARDMGVEVLASLPISRGFAEWADSGGGRSGSYGGLEVAEILDSLVDGVVSRVDGAAGAGGAADMARANASGAARRAGAEGAAVPEAGPVEGVFAIPTENGRLCAHFGHCEEFTLVEVADDGEPAIKEVCPAPPHEPGLLPPWLAGKGVGVVIAGGIGARAQQIFAENGVRVLCGAPALEPLELVRRYLEGSLELGENVCDH